MKTVGVVGAGPSGLCAARHVLNTEGLELLMWERSAHVGGTWRYTDSTGVDQHGLPIHSSMYKSLRTDIPKEIMAFLDYPFHKEGPSFLSHSQVLKYLEDYSNHYNINQHVKFSHNVENIEPVDVDNPQTGWKIKVKDLCKGDIIESKCDYVIVCNGHFSEPRFPEFFVNTFKGNELHSHNYKSPDAYAGHNVVILGMGASGLDISLDVASKAKQVYLSHDLPDPLPSVLPSNMKQVKGVVEMRNNSAILSNGEELSIDDIIYCTGYKYTYPFLTKSCGIEVQNNQVLPLFNHLINIKHNTMALVGIPSQIVSFPLFDFQVQYFISYATGKFTLPSQEVMQETLHKEMKDFEKEGNKARHFHRFRDRQFDYMSNLASDANLKPLPNYIEEILDKTIHRLIFEFTIFKNFKYEVNEDGTFKDYIDNSLVQE